MEHKIKTPIDVACFIRDYIDPDLTSTYDPEESHSNEDYLWQIARNNLNEFNDVN